MASSSSRRPAARAAEAALPAAAALVLAYAWAGRQRAPRIPRLFGASASEPLPSYFKYHEALLNPPRDQLGCASCWAFAVCDMAADALNLRTEGAWGVRPLSPQYLLSCAPGLTQSCEEGGIPEEALESPAATSEGGGIPLESEVPYRADEGPCAASSARPSPGGVRVRIAPGSSLSLCDDPSLALPGMRGATVKRNVANMKRAIMRHGPVVGTLRVTEDLYDYAASEIYRQDPASAFVGYHAVLIVGWCDARVNSAEPGFDGAYWVIKSSWGQHWGVPEGVRSGYAYVAMGENIAEVESRASVATAVLPDGFAEAEGWQKRTAYWSYDDYARDPDRDNFLGAVARAHAEQRGAREKGDPKP
ncbi:hypothetical protein JKP88DRAFT_166050 [Tribonema minus]|uniref:Peptidase C1A papain C-terminal domain-containing protein n=1 Tax=Tribonema minus TaxID=303371 RepID=A0A836CC90_9STRA|nr:hypothetical protein JKP88DRAFT_166050 [Tribonema minus]